MCPDHQILTSPELELVRRYSKTAAWFSLPVQCRLLPSEKGVNQELQSWYWRDISGSRRSTTSGVHCIVICRSFPGGSTRVPYQALLQVTAYRGYHFFLNRKEWLHHPGKWEQFI